MARELFPIELLESIDLSPTIKHLRFKRCDGKPFDFIPGQFINLHLDYQGEVLQRSYSVACPPNDNNEMDIAIAYVDNGRASNILFSLKPGDTVQASGPFGRLVLKDEDEAERYILVATGTGVAPYRSMLPALSQRFADRPDLKVDLVLGVRTVQDLLYDQDFTEFARQNPQFRFFACTSREANPRASTTDIHGRVTQVFPTLSANPEQDIIYLCGNPEMIDEAYKYFCEEGFTFKNVRREKYVFSK